MNFLTKAYIAFKNRNDQPKTGPDVRTVDNWTLRPIGTEYRVVEYQDGKLGLQSLIGAQWQDVECYDNGWDDYGKLDAGRWKLLAHSCRWDKRGLMLLKEKLEGVTREPRVIG